MKDVHITEQRFFGENVISFEEHVNALILCPLSDAEHESQGWKRISLDKAQKLANRVGHDLTTGDAIIYWFKILETIEEEN